MKAGVRRRVFCGSMCDWCEDHVTVQREREKLQSIILAGVQVGEQEVLQRYLDQNIKYTADYVFFDPKRTELNGFSVFRFAPRAGRLQSRAFYKTAAFSGQATGFEQTVVWQARDGWVREFDRQVEQRALPPQTLACGTLLRRLASSTVSSSSKRSTMTALENGISACVNCSTFSRTISEAMNRSGSCAQ